MSITTVETMERIACDNPECNVYLDKGDFPGSPVQLKFRVSLRHGLIESLEFAPRKQFGSASSPQRR